MAKTRISLFQNQTPNQTYQYNKNNPSPQISHISQIPFLSSHKHPKPSYNPFSNDPSPPSYLLLLLKEYEMVDCLQLNILANFGYKYIRCTKSFIIKLNPFNEDSYRARTSISHYHIHHGRWAK